MNPLRAAIAQAPQGDTTPPTSGRNLPFVTSLNQGSCRGSCTLADASHQDVEQDHVGPVILGLIEDLPAAFGGDHAEALMTEREGHDGPPGPASGRQATSRFDHS